ncbi:MAG: VWA domain-containing protein [Bryobacterales bacterium]|nr:VWA domain-containing protein [Bryobacterales bacterium]
MRKVWALVGAFFLVVGNGLIAGDNEKKQAGPQPRVNIEPRARPADPDAPKDRKSPNIRVDTTLVQINVTVTTPLNQVVTGMEREHFRLFEDKTEQQIVSFTSEEAPLSIGLVFDVSGSMGNKLNRSRQAAAQFFKTANPEDEFFLVQFNERPELVIPWTTNTEEIQNRLAFTQAKGRTALLDGLYLAMNQMKKARNPRKAILVLSDGGDNSSRYTESEIKNLVREADVQVYAIGIFEQVAGRGRTAEELAGPGLLTEIAEQTGGRHFPIDNLNELPDVAAKIGVELRSQYVLGYSPSNLQKDGKYRRVEVKLVQPRGLPPLRAYYRTGYYAPTQ